MIRLATARRIIDAPIGQVWAVTSSFGTIQAWIPGITEVSIEGAGIGAVRTVTWQGATVREQLTEIDADLHHVRYALHADVLVGLHAPRGGTDLTALDDGATLIEWVSEAEATNGDVSPMGAMLDDFMNASIDGLARLLNAPMRPA